MCTKKDKPRPDTEDDGMIKKGSIDFGSANVDSEKKNDQNLDQLENIDKEESE